MNRYVPKTYNNLRAVRIVLRAFAIVVLAFVILFVSLFFGLRRYIVYTEDGLRLEIPFLMEGDTDE